MRSGGQLRILLSLLALLAGCAPSSDERVLPALSSTDGVELAVVPDLPSALDPARVWTLRARHRILTTTEGGDPIIWDARRVLPLRDGTILVHDPMAEPPLVQIDVSTGEGVRWFGRSGEGPGELGPGVVMTLADSGDRYEVYDASNQQVHTYSDTGEWLGSSSLELDGWAMDLQPGPRGGALLQSLQRSDEAWWNELKEIQSGHVRSGEFMRLPEPPPGAEPGPIQKGRALWAVLPDAVVAMWSTAPSIAVHDSAGELIRVIRLPLTRRVLTERDIAVQIARHGSIARTLEPGPAALTNMLYSVNDSVFGMFMSNLWGAEEDPPLPEGSIILAPLHVEGGVPSVVLPKSLAHRRASA